MLYQARSQGGSLGLDEPPFQIVKNKNKAMFTRIDNIVSYDVNLSERWTSNIDHDIDYKNYQRGNGNSTALIIFIETVMTFFKNFACALRTISCIRTLFYKTLPTVLYIYIYIYIYTNVEKSSESMFCETLPTTQQQSN